MWLIRPPFAQANLWRASMDRIIQLKVEFKIILYSVQYSRYYTNKYICTFSTNDSIRIWFFFSLSRMQFDHYVEIYRNKYIFLFLFLYILISSKTKAKTVIGNQQMLLIFHGCVAFQHSNRKIHTLHNFNSHEYNFISGTLPCSYIHIDIG